MNNLVKHSGQVFTPDYIVNLMLDELGYNGPCILKKHCVDNSCGNGAFICEIVRRYVKAYKQVDIKFIEDLKIAAKNIEEFAKCQKNSFYNKFYK